MWLDLRGAVHLTQTVNTEDAFKATSAAASEQLRESLKIRGIVPAAINTVPPNAFRVEGVPADKDAQFRQAADEVAGTNYDRNPLAGGTYEFKLKPNIERDLREQAVEQAMLTIDRRVNDLGVAQPSIAREPNGEEILIQLPGVTDVARAKAIMAKTAPLEFK